MRSNYPVGLTIDWRRVCAIMMSALQLLLSTFSLFTPLKHFLYAAQPCVFLSFVTVFLCTCRPRRVRFPRVRICIETVRTDAMAQSRCTFSPTCHVRHDSIAMETRLAIGIAGESPCRPAAAAAARSHVHNGTVFLHTPITNHLITYACTERSMCDRFAFSRREQVGNA